MLGSLFVFTLFLSDSAKADMNGYIAPGFLMTQSLAEDEKGARMGAHIEFARLTSYVAADLRYQSGKGYSDYGAFLKLYYPWELSPGWTLQLGGGGGGMYSKGFEEVDRAFWDLIVHPFVGMLWNWNDNFGLLMNLGWDLQIYRAYRGDELEPQYDNTRRNRVLFSVSLAFGA